MSLTETERGHLDRIIDSTMSDAPTKTSAPSNESVYHSLAPLEGSNPDKDAQAQDLAFDSALPIQVAERKFRSLDHQKKMSDIIDQVMSRPKTAQYLADPYNAKVSKDDVPQLTGLEQWLGPMKPDYNVARALGETGTSLIGNLLQAGSTVTKDVQDYVHENVIPALGALNSQGLVSMMEYFETLEIPMPDLTPGPDGISWSVGTEDEVDRFGKLGSQLAAPGLLGYVPDFTWEKLKGEPTATNLLGTMYEQGIRSVPHMLAAVYTLPAYIASRTYEFAEARERNNFGDDVTSGDLLKNLPATVLVAALDRFAGKVVLGPKEVTGLGTLAGSTATATGIEATTEAIQEGVEYTATHLGTEKGFNLAKAGESMLAGAVIGGPIGGVIHGTLASAQAARNYETKAQISERVEQQEELVLENLITFAQESKTNERSPRHFNAFVESVESDHELSFDSDAITPLLDLPEVPDSVANLLAGVLEEDLGNDLIIPIDTFLADVVPNEALFEFMRPHVKMSPISRSKTQAVEPDIELDELLRRAEEEQTTQTELDERVSQLTKQLVDTGVLSDKEAELSIAPIVEYATLQAAELGIQPADYLSEMGLRILSEKDSSSAAPPHPDLTLDQNFGDIMFTERVKVAGKKVKATQKAQVVWDKAATRRTNMEALLKCLA